jgi:YegS/Rv2252/BmrU family lipid kinase
MHHFIINPRSRTGRGIKIWTTVKKELDTAKVPYTYHFTEYEYHATKIAEDICKEYSGIKNIVVLGGDGTVNEVINGIEDYNSVLLGYIPTGSSNDLARSLVLPKDPIQSLKHILSPKEFKYVDTGEIIIQKTGLKRKFAVSTGMGFDAAICEETFRSNLKTVLNKYGLGKLTYIIIALKQLITCPFMNGNITIDGKQAKTYKNMLLITSMIQRFEGGGMKIAPAANPSDGKLSICIVHGLSRVKILLLLPTLLFGKHIHFKGVETFDCETLFINLNDPAGVHVDGEYPGEFESIQVSCLSKQLRIII